MKIVKSEAEKMKIDTFTDEPVLKKKHNTAETSKESYKEVLRSGKKIRESDRVLLYLKDHQPITARSLSYGIGIEKNNITRCLYDLVNLGKVKIAFTDKCTITQHTVRYYTLIDWVQPAAQLKVA